VCLSCPINNIRR